MRVVAQRHDGDGDGDGGDSQQLSSRGASADIAPLACVLFSFLVAWGCSCKTNRTKENIREKQDSFNSSQQIQ